MPSAAVNVISRLAFHKPSVLVLKKQTVCTVKTPRIVPRKARATRVLVNHFLFKHFFLTHPQFCVSFWLPVLKNTLKKWQCELQ